MKNKSIESCVRQGRKYDGCLVRVELDEYQVFHCPVPRRITTEREAFDYALDYLADNWGLEACYEDCSIEEIYSI